MKFPKAKVEVIEINENNSHWLSYLRFNRKYGPNREDLIKSIRENGFIGTVIIFKANLYGKIEYFVADGQHRIAVAMYLGIPAVGKVENIKINNLQDAVKFVASLNTSQKKWSPDDYVHAYASLLIDDYIKLNKLRNQSIYSAATLSTLLMGKSTSKANGTQDIKNGTFKISYYDETLATLEFVSKKLNKFGKVPAKILAPLHYVRITGKFNEAKFIENYKCNIAKIIEMSPDMYVNMFMSWYTK
jgi:hypothetical protein